MPREHISYNRVRELERTVDELNGTIREVQEQLQHFREGSLPERVWRHFLITRHGKNEFMSTVCNRRARPNMKVTHASSSAGQ